MRYFMLTREIGRKGTIIHGLKTIVRPGNIANVTQFVEVFFEHGKLTEVDDDSLNFSHAIKDLLIVEVKKNPKNKIDQLASILKKKEEKKEEREDSIDIELSNDNDNNKEIVNEVNTDDKYVSIEGGYKCLLCEAEGNSKVLKNEKRMITHIEEKH